MYCQARDTLGRVARQQIDPADEATLAEAARFASAAAALATTRRGAALAMPARDEVNR